jgi:hypothetical protein
VDVHVPLPGDIARLAKLTALQSRTTVPELISILIRDHVDRLAEPDSPADRHRKQVLSPEARALLDVISGVDLEFVPGWVPSMSIQQAVIDAGLWREIHENLIWQRVTDVMAELGLTRDNRGKRRIDIRADDGKKSRLTVFSAKMIGEAVTRYRPATRSDRNADDQRR